MEFIMEVEYKLTDIGRKECENYISELKAKKRNS